MTDTAIIRATHWSRRNMLRAVAMGTASISIAPLLGSCARTARVQPAAGAVVPMAIPLPLAGLYHHTGISVPDVLAAATFYSRLFGGDKVEGEAEPSVRYFINLNPGRVAIGLLGTLGSTGKTQPLIDHICIDAVPFDDAAWRARLVADNWPYIASGVFLGIDNIPIQVAGGEGGESLSTGEVTAMPVLYDGPALVRAEGLDHVMMLVSDVPAASQFWQRMFGLQEISNDGTIAWLGLGGASRLGLRKAGAGEQYGAAYQAVRAAYDPGTIRPILASLAARILPNLAYDIADGVRFIGPDGIETALVPA